LTDTTFDGGSVAGELGRIVFADMALDDVLARVCELAKLTIPGAAEVGVTLVDAGRAQTAAFTGELAVELDERQYEAGHGPCLESARTGAEFHIHDMSTEPRWPDYTPKAALAGALSSMSLPLPVGDHVVGALNVYATKPKAFGPPEADTARLFASQVAVALRNAQMFAASRALAEQMTQAMASRAVIEQAKGILMGQRRCTADEAFELLRSLSQNSNRKLRDVAQALVDTAAQTGGTAPG
jgi:GAF domain-containing protein